MCDGKCVVPAENAGNELDLAGCNDFGSAVLISLWFAWSVFAGGVISICSFWVSNKDVMRLIDSVSSLSSPEDRKAQAQQGQKGYLLKFWLRIVLIGVVLLLLIKGKAVNIFGLILGLSTVVFSIMFIVFGFGQALFLQREEVKGVMEHPILFISIILEKLGLPVPHGPVGHTFLEQICAPYMTYTWLVMAFLFLVSRLTLGNLGDDSRKGTEFLGTGNRWDG